MEIVLLLLNKIIIYGADIMMMDSTLNYLCNLYLTTNNILICLCEGLQPFREYLA